MSQMRATRDSFAACSGDAEKRRGRLELHDEAKDRIQVGLEFRA